MAKERRSWTEKARLYERLFSYRDISEEVRFLHRLFSKHGLKTVLDIACGHAPHGRRLASVGYSVSGLDVSPSLLRLGRLRAKAEGLDIRLHNRDMRRFRLGRFDAAYTMFSSILHLYRHEDLLSHFDAVSRNLKKDGLYVIDLSRAPFDTPLKHKRIVKRSKKMRAVLTYEPLDTRQLTAKFTSHLYNANKSYVDSMKVLMFMPVPLLSCYAMLAGFTVIAVSSDFKGRRTVRDAQTTYIAILRKTGSSHLKMRAEAIGHRSVGR